MTINARGLLLAALVAASVAVLQGLLTFDPAQIADWRLWAAGLGAAAVRAMAAALIGVLAGDAKVS